MAYSIETSVHIEAPVSRVWSVLMDFDAYPAWNPFIRSIKGEKTIGAKLEVVIEPPGRKAETFRPVIIELAPERVFCWRGSLPVPGLFVGEHRFELTDETTGTRFVQSERFSGLLVPFVKRILADTERGFLAMNEELKVRTENR